MLQRTQSKIYTVGKLLGHKHRGADPLWPYPLEVASSVDIISVDRRTWPRLHRNTILRAGCQAVPPARTQHSYNFNSQSSISKNMIISHVRLDYPAQGLCQLEVSTYVATLNEFVRNGLYKVNNSIIIL
jgi:hypothetical protein